MRGTWRRAPAILLALFTLLVFSAAALAPDPASDPGSQPGRVVVGDLLLADDDQEPRDGVEHSFHASNMAPGDVARGHLRIVREPFQSHSDPLRTKVAISFHSEGPLGPMADHLRLEQLTYGGMDLRALVALECGQPLTMHRLVDCTAGPSNPLDELPDPTTRGRNLVLAVRFAETVGNEGQGAAMGFKVRVDLEAQALAFADRVARSYGPSNGAGPMEQPGRPPNPAAVGLPDPPAPTTAPTCAPDRGKGKLPVLAQLDPRAPRPADAVARLQPLPELPQPPSRVPPVLFLLEQRLPGPCQVR